VKTWPDWRSVVSFSAEGPGVTLLHESPELKVVLVGLEVGQALVVHLGPAALFHFLDGDVSRLSARKKLRWRRGDRDRHDRDLARGPGDVQAGLPWESR
jgi:hypothetical protein